MRKAKITALIMIVVCVLMNSSLFAQPKKLPSPLEVKSIKYITSQAENPRWSSQGDKIAFATDRKPNTWGSWAPDYLYIMDADGKNLTKLPHPISTGKEESSSKIRSFCWSPDGKKIAFIWQTFYRGTNPDICILDLTSQPIPTFSNLTQGQLKYFDVDYFCNSVVWSPDGKKLSFVKEGSHVPDVSIIDSNGEFVYKLHDGYSPVWLSNKRVAFLGEKVLFASPNVLFEKAPVLLWIIDIDGENKETIDLDISFFRQGRRGQEKEKENLKATYAKIYFSPDNKRVYLEVTGEYIFQTDVDFIAVKELDKAGDWKIIISGKSFERLSQLSPDGKEIIFSGADGDIWKVSSIPIGANVIDKRPPSLKNLTNIPKAAQNKDDKCREASWSPDGKKIVFVRQKEVWTMNSDGSDQKQLTFLNAEAIEEAKRKQAEEKADRERKIKEVLSNE